MLEAAARKVGRPDASVCETLVLHEADLLDKAKFDEWLTLYTPDCSYWVPSDPDQQDPFETVSLMYDDRRLLETRIRRLSSPVIYSQEPRSRTLRLVTVVDVEKTADDGIVWETRSKFMMLEYRREQQRVFGGIYAHHLVWLDDRLMIKQKRVNLLNCDAPLDGLAVPF